MHLMTHTADSCRPSGAAMRIAAVVLLTPLIVAAAVLAVGFVLMMILSGWVRAAVAARRRPPLATVAQLNTSHAEHAVEMVTQRAA